MSPSREQAEVGTPDGRLLTPAFVIVTAATFAYFMTIGITIRGVH